MSDHIRWGILGTGAIARAFAEGLAFLPDARLTAVASRSADSAASFAEAYAVPRVHGSYEALLSDSEVDVVYVATPNHLHMEHALSVIESGKALLCEKPFALDAGQSREVTEAAERRGVFCMEAMWTRFLPAVDESVTRLRSGEIGDLRLASIQLGLPFVPDPRARQFDPAMGGGALLDLGVYPVFLSHLLFGRPDVVQSRAVLGSTGVDEQVSVLLGYSGGRQAVITTSIRSQLANDAFVAGTTGSLRLHAPLYCPERYTIMEATPIRPGAGSARGKLVKLRHHPLVRPVVEQLRARLPLGRGGRSRTFTRRPLGNGYTEEAREVGDCLRRGLRSSPRMPPAETVAVLETLDRIRDAWGTAS